MEEKMIVRIASVEEMKKLWGYSESPTYNYFVDGMEKCNIEFWTIEEIKTNKLIGELYIFWDSEDKDEANGYERAYLCAFRVEADYQGRGLGSKLMNRVFERLEEKLVKEVTIGIDNDEYEKLSAMYEGWGFTKLVKYKNVDIHSFDRKGNVEYCQEPYKLMMKEF